MGRRGLAFAFDVGRMNHRRAAPPRLTPVALCGAGYLYTGHRLICEVAYHLIGWPDAHEESTHVAGVLRRLAGGDLAQLVGDEWLSVNLDGDMWWNCVVVHRDGWTTSRDMGVHRR